MDKAEHLFISYAGEDWVFADWLARKLASEGYAVWFDRFKLLGGESYPRDIDDAIKRRTFRLIALLSRSSIHKANPVKERTLALNIARERNIDFLIPLNLDGLGATELDWMTSDLTFIPFDRNWQSGFSQLVKKLRSVEAPTPLSNGLRLAASTYKPRTSLSDKGEQLISNIMPVSAFPKYIFRYRFNKSIPRLEYAGIQKQWAFMSKGTKDVLSFQSPPENIGSIKVVDSKRYSLDREKLDGISTQYIISALLSKSIRNEFLRLGCKQTPDGRSLYLPSGLLKRDHIEFASYTGRKSWVQYTGTRTIRSSGQKTLYHYHLCPTFRIRMDLENPFCLQLSSSSLLKISS